MTAPMTSAGDVGRSGKLKQHSVLIQRVYLLSCYKLSRSVSDQGTLRALRSRL